MLRRRALWTPFLAVIGVGVVASVLLALPRPTGSDVFVARTARWLIDYRLVASRERLDGRTIRGVCISTWFRPLTRSGRHIRGSFTVLNTGAHVFDSHHDLRLLRGRLPTTLLDEIDLAGCPRALALVVDRLLTHRERLITIRSRLEGHDVIELKLRRSVFLEIERSTAQPLAVLVREKHGDLRSELTFQHLTPHEERALQKVYDQNRRRIDTRASRTALTLNCFGRRCSLAAQPS
jgi:hypothetical protein